MSKFPFDRDNTSNRYSQPKEEIEQKGIDDEDFSTFLIIEEKLKNLELARLKQSLHR